MFFSCILNPSLYCSGLHTLKTECTFDGLLMNNKAIYKEFSTQKLHYFKEM